MFNGLPLEDSVYSVYVYVYTLLLLLLSLLLYRSANVHSSRSGAYVLIEFLISK
jgi:hypothetical protein